MSGGKRVRKARRPPISIVKTAPFTMRDLLRVVERDGVWSVGKSTVGLTIFCIDGPGLPDAIADNNPLRSGRRRAAHEWTTEKFGASWATSFTTGEMVFIATVASLYVCEPCQPFFAQVAEVQDLNRQIKRLSPSWLSRRRSHPLAAVQAQRDELLARIRVARYATQKTCLLRQEALRNKRDTPNGVSKLQNHLYAETAAQSAANNLVPADDVPKAIEEQESPGRAVAGFFGVTKAPKYVTGRGRR